MPSLRITGDLMDPTANDWDPAPKAISTKKLAEMVLLQPPISVRHLIELGSTWIQLNLVMQYQQQKQWCWAATTCNVVAYYISNTIWTQCKLVNAAFGRSDCCINGSSGDCNNPWNLDKALTITGNFQSWSAGAASIEDIAKELNNNHPICVRIGWPDNTGHALAIDGCHVALGVVSVADPWSGPSTVIYNTFIKAYNGNGTWTDTYYTKP